MLRKLNSLIGYTITATDEEIGSVDDFYFDERTWTVRYLVVDTGSWFSGKKVLISQDALGQPFWDNESFPVNLTKKQIEESPSIDLAKPISRQHEAQLSSYYDWPMYWLAASGAASGSAIGATGLGGVTPVVAPAGVAAATATQETTAGREAEMAESHTDPAATELNSSKSLLRSVKEVKGYNIAANDGDIGHLDDLFVDDSEWTIHYALVDTRNWLPGRKVLIAPNWASNFDWQESKFHVDMTKEQIKNSPEYKPQHTIDRSYEKDLHNYYGLPGYWV